MARSCLTRLQMNSSLVNDQATAALANHNTIANAHTHPFIKQDGHSITAQHFGRQKISNEIRQLQNLYGLVLYFFGWSIFYTRTSQLKSLNLNF